MSNTTTSPSKIMPLNISKLTSSVTKADLSVKKNDQKSNNPADKVTSLKKSFDKEVLNKSDLGKTSISNLFNKTNLSISAGSSVGYKDLVLSVLKKKTTTNTS